MRALKLSVKIAGRGLESSDCFCHSKKGECILSTVIYYGFPPAWHNQEVYQVSLTCFPGNQPWIGSTSGGTR